jgi:signal transduction histidine kinase
LTIGAWAFVAAVFVVQNIVGELGRGAALNWRNDVVNECVYWIAFATLTPLFVLMARRYSLIAPPRMRALCVQVLASFPIAALQVALNYTLLAIIAIVLGKLTLSGIPTWFATRRNFALLLVITAFWKYWVIIALIHGVEYARLYAQEQRDASALREQLTAAKLDQLKARLQPHFLFNTLNGIAVLLRDDPERARTMLVRLSEMLRGVIQAGEEQFVTLREEMAMVHRYLDIQEMRLGDRLQTLIDVPQDVSEHPVPHFLIQPLVENAVQHGVARAELGGIVSIRVRRDSTHLDIEVRDILRGSVASNEDSAGSGIGLRTTRERLARLYGDSYRLDMQPAGGGGTVVTLRLPIEQFADRN